MSADQLADSDGDTLSAYDPDAGPALPSSADALTQSVAVDEADGVYISYPETLQVLTSNAANRYVNFEAVSGDEVRNSILANYIEMGSGYDRHFDCGADSARYVLLQMADIVMNAIWGSDKIVGYSRFEFTDNGDYYGLRVWGVMKGSALTGSTEDNVPMVLEIRYVGPVGYLPVMMCMADNERIDEYYAIMHNMFDSMTYPTGWSTTPTRQASGSDYNPYSDPGDTNNWYDDYYYVDDDGVNPYDSDAGGWSDPGDSNSNMYWDGDMWLEGQTAGW